MVGVSLDDALVLVAIVVVLESLLSVTSIVLAEGILADKGVVVV